MKIFYCILLLLSCSFDDCFSQNAASPYIHLNTLPVEGDLLDTGWKFQAGDNPEWAKPQWDASKWIIVRLSGYNTYLPQLKTKNIGWFRLNLLIDSSVREKQLAIQLSQLGASEIYLNGELFQRFGTIETRLGRKSFNPVNKPYLLPVHTGNAIVIAIRFASDVPSRTWLFTSTNKLPLTVTINSWEDAFRKYETDMETARILTRFSYLYITLALLFIVLYAFFPKDKVNLLFSALWLFAVTRSFLAFQISQGSFDISRFSWISFLLVLNDMLEGLLILSIICQAVWHRITLFCWIIFFGLGIDSLLYLLLGPAYFQIILNFLLHVLVTFAFFQLGVSAFRQRKYIIGIVSFNGGILNLYFFRLLLHINVAFRDDFLVLFTMTANFILITIYIAMNFARKSKNVEVQLVEIEKLSQDNLKKEQEKQHLLSSQNERLELQVAERTAALQRSLEELKSTQAQLIQSEKMASLGELTAGIAHEIQNPLNFVNNFSEVNKELLTEMRSEIEKGNLNEVAAIAGDVIVNEEKINHYGKRADSIVKGMLQHSRGSTGQKELTNINDLAEEYLRLSYHGFRAKDKFFNTTLKTDPDSSIEKINIIPQDIGRVLLNLYNNAFYAVAEKKKQQPAGYEPAVSVSTKKLNKTIEIRVRDNGNGIPQKLVDKVFQPFVTTKPAGQGVGLGLSLSYDIIKAHGGEINVNSVEGEFAEFVIRLPIE